MFSIINADNLQQYLAPSCLVSLVCPRLNDFCLPLWYLRIPLMIIVYEMLLASSLISVLIDTGIYQILEIVWFTDGSLLWYFLLFFVKVYLLHGSFPLTYQFWCPRISIWWCSLISERKKKFVHCHADFCV